MKNNLLVKLIIGIITGILIGLTSASLEVMTLVKLMSTFSGLFGGFLKFLIPCIILGFVATGIADLGKHAGKLLGITTALAYISTLGAGFLAYFLGMLFLPQIITRSEIVEVSARDVAPFFTIDMGVIFGVMTALVLAFILGIGMANLDNKALYFALKDFQKIVEKVIKYAIIPLMPLHIAGIFAQLSATGEILNTIRAFGSVFAMILIVQGLYLIIQYTLAWSISGKAPHKAAYNMLPAYITALGTQSSAATIAVSLQCAKQNQLDQDVVDFVIPLGATIHLAGDTITLVLASMAVMILSGTIPTFAVMMPFIFMLGVTMVAAPGIPGGGVMAALGLLENMLGFSAAQQGLMIAIHFAQDSFGTATNVTGDGALAIIIDRFYKKGAPALPNHLQEDHIKTS